MDKDPDGLTTSRTPADRPAGQRAPLVDRFGRHVTYLRISVTDRCDLRCTYCMAENMKFLPKREVLSFEEIDLIASAFIARGVNRVRLTGGEPLVRRDIMKLIGKLGGHLASGALNELTLTTNGTQLEKHAGALYAAGVRRVNVSLDTRKQKRFIELTRRDRLASVLGGIGAARTAGLGVKINMVALRGINDDEIEDMLEWAHGEGMDLTLIEAMPLGEVAISRADTHLPLKELHEKLSRRYTLEHVTHSTGGPARYFRVAETGGRLGLIAPMSHNFCESCNRVRLTATGQLYLCLGKEDRVDLRRALNTGGLDGLNATLDRAMILKPKGHDFLIDRADPAPAIARHMSVTGG